jgi:hypothetical protein
MLAMCVQFAAPEAFSKPATFPVSVFLPSHRHQLTPEYTGIMVLSKKQASK